ncbi:hypothetical protein LIER_13861 [Lithospermum erythrorhizon]|uniref:Transposase n=1 Tax=Lithospermum erythrorhizon TaxID=34254 RepID=A0AAV3PX24_LITER
MHLYLRRGRFLIKERKLRLHKVMYVCLFDMLFTYVMFGWEGTANDARIFLECVAKPENKFPLPPGELFHL